MGSSQGHVWQTTPAVVIRGSWCPNCVILDRTKKPQKRKRYDVEGSLEPRRSIAWLVRTTKLTAP